MCVVITLLYTNWNLMQFLYVSVSMQESSTWADRDVTLASPMDRQRYIIHTTSHTPEPYGTDDHDM